MIEITETAQNHFRALLLNQGSDAVGIRVSALNPGRPNADARLEFAEQGDLLGDEWQIECQGFTLFVDASSIAFLNGAHIDLTESGTSTQLVIRAPNIKGKTPDAESPLAEQVMWLIDSEINPQLAAHKGKVSLDSIDADNVVYLRFGGGCQGCSMVDITLKQGVEKTIIEKIPQITAVRDATDHASGSAPYMSR
ncbi:MAG TPA: NfuA family Fe-S biogenesis protein [Arenimonas sp.]|nr:NfuA family Fe-S biogenesis protein [Arenimonas sp.]